MAKRRTFEEKLLDDLLTLEPNKWFKIDSRPDYDKFVVAVKMLIDTSYPFVFSGDYKKIKYENSEYKAAPPLYHKMKVLPAGVTIIERPRGFEDEIEIKGRKIIVTLERKSYRIYANDKLIAIE